MQQVRLQQMRRLLRLHNRQVRQQLSRTVSFRSCQQQLLLHSRLQRAMRQLALPLLRRQRSQRRRSRQPQSLHRQQPRLHRLQRHQQLLLPLLLQASRPTLSLHLPVQLL